MVYCYIIIIDIYIFRSAADDNILPLLSYLCCHGNTTVHEWKYGEPPKEKKVGVASKINFN